MSGYIDKTISKLANDLELYSKKVLTIKTIDGNMPFIFNAAQKYIHSKLQQQLKDSNHVRAIIVKGRQMGCSTYIGARFYHNTANNFSKKTYVMAHDAKTTSALFDMTLRYHKYTDTVLRPSTSQLSQNKLVFDKLESEYAIGTAGSGEVGRGLTLNYVHGSEVAFWPHGERIAGGLFGAVPYGKKTEIILESTANGTDNYFYSQWKEACDGNSDYQPIFIPWYWHAENSRELKPGITLTSEEKELKKAYNLTDNQVYWRRLKISSLTSSGEDGEWVFKREYPFTAVEAFETSISNGFIRSDLVAAARRYKAISLAKDTRPLIMGVDVARFGDDKTVMILRQGNKAFSLKIFDKLDNMEIAGIIKKTLDMHDKIHHVYIDIGGGAGVCDRLNELGYAHRVKGINFGSASEDPKYLNKRAEMWGRMRDWFNDGDVEIPDSDLLHEDITCVKYTYHSDSKIKLEKKEEIKKRLKRSPDTSDALALTFANDFYDLSNIDFSNILS